MQRVNQKILQNNLFKALIPGEQLIDGRSEQDYLNYLVKISQVINFYNQDNTLSGSWQPFLLKDPVFLLIAISKYEISDTVKLFNKIRYRTDSKAASLNDVEKYREYLNPLFNINYKVYDDLERWSEFMLADPTIYRVKNTVISEIETKFSKLFWAIVALNQFITTQYPEWKIAPTDSLRNVFTSGIWRTNKDKQPFYNVLGLVDKFSFSFEQVLAALSNATNELLTFVSRLMELALEDQVIVSKFKSDYPDTVLLRVIVKLLLEQNKSINSLSSRHLDFYYKTILAQSPKPAKPDMVYSDVHTGVDQLIRLTKGTIFNCGTDLNSNPVDFSSINDCVINPATIGATQTLYKKKIGSDKYQLFSTVVNGSGKVNRDDKGQIIAWNAFGEESGDPVVTSFVCGSPMFYLPGGNRTLTLKIKFVQTFTVEVFDNAKFYLSTAEQWIASQPEISFDSKTREVVSSFKFDSDFPAIVCTPFENSGIQSKWPLLRIDFNWFYEATATPTIEYIVIENSVDKAKDIVLYNQNGLIAAMPGLQPFGSTASINSKLVIGSVEIFSKPVTRFDFTFDWGELPKDFSDYYKAYNIYLSQPDPVPVQNSLVPKLFFTLAGWLRKKLFKGNISQKQKVAAVEYFNNGCFKTGFEVLSNGTWNSYELLSESTSTTANTDLSSSKGNTPKGFVETNTCDLYPKLSNNHTDFEGTHFNVVNPVIELENNVIISGWPELQYEEYNFTQNATKGFSRLYLSAPGHGFGSDIYPAVVAYTATQNGLLISNSWFSGPPNLLANPQLPFVPVAQNLEVNYSASHKYIIKEKNTYPIDCFYFTPFAKYKVFDSNPDEKGSVNINGFSLNTQNKIADSLPLYPTFEGRGTLYIGLQKLITPAIVNFYMEVANSVGQFDWSSISVKSLDSSGWFDITVVADETRALSETGILSLSCPDNMISDSELMQNGFFWFAFTNTSEEILEAQISYINTNGVKLERCITSEDISLGAIQLSPNSMAVPPVDFPAITSVNQPFPSFGGKPKESGITMNQRVAVDISTKGQLVFKSDYYRLIENNFPEIFYSKVVKNRKRCMILLVQKSDEKISTSPFSPLIGGSMLATVSNFINQRNSVFADTDCAPFGQEIVTIEATIIINNTVGSDFAKEDINNRLNFYFSPWTKTDLPQIAIDSPIYLEQVLQIINDLPYVKNVQNLFLKTGLTDAHQTKQSAGNAIIPAQPDLLFVSAGNHNLTIKVEI